MANANSCKSTVLLLILLLFSCCGTKPSGETIPDDGTSIYYQLEQKPFYHGVASGDPLTDRVIIWTRVTPEYQGEVEVQWAMAADERMSNVVQSGKNITGVGQDYTIKVDVDGLEPGTTYFYQFEALGSKSPVGRTRTAPGEDPEEIKLAVVSCSNFEAGYFNALGRIADRSDLDAVLHLGDYIYEYGVGRYGDTTLGRLNLPPGEIIKLDDYRTRYALYRLDKDFQRVHQRHPFITIWDDHEITNNSYADGAQNHQPEEGDYIIRKAEARQAYYEWLPVREGEHLYRAFSFGNLVDLFMLDERLAGRTVQVDSISDPTYRDSTRSMLGKTQWYWLQDQLSNSDATWKILGNQVVFSELDFSKLSPKRPRNLDAWDGYPTEKEKVIGFIGDNEIKNVIFVTGDTHTSMAFESPVSLAKYREDTTAIIATEFAITSITSPNYDESYPRDSSYLIENIYREGNPHLKFINISDHGYLLLSLTSGAAIAEYWYVDTVKEPSSNESMGKSMRVERGKKELE